MISSPPKIEGYKVVREIGSGGFSTVYLVQQGNQFYAAKAIPKIGKKAAAHNQCNKEFIEREIRVMQKSKHPNISYIIDLLSDSSNIYIIEEYIPTSLFNLIEEKKKTFMEFTARPIIFQVLQAISYLHSIGFCHRDIKPHNILIRDDGTIKLIDFGLSTPINVTNVRCGSKYFFPPEVLLPMKHIAQSNTEKDKCSHLFDSNERYEQNHTNTNIDGIKCDSWCCGITFFLILTGKMPWSKMSIEQITTEKIQYPLYLSNECIDFLDKLLTIDPKKRITVKEALQHKWILKDINTYKDTSFNLPTNRLSSEKIEKILTEFQLLPKESIKQLNYHMNYNMRINENDIKDQNINKSLLNKTDFNTLNNTLSCDKENSIKSFSSSMMIEDSNSSLDIPLHITPSNKTLIPTLKSHRTESLYSTFNCLKDLTNKIDTNSDKKKAKVASSSFNESFIFNNSSHEEKERALNTQVESIFQKINAMKKSKK